MKKTGGREGCLSDHTPKSLKRQRRWRWGLERHHGEILDYLQDLGIDILWLSPIYKGPLLTRVVIFLTIMPLIPYFGTRYGRVDRGR